MIIIIDGYNVLKNVYYKASVDESKRMTFVRQLNEYAIKKGHTIMLVFDGGPFSYPFKEQYDKVTVIFSGIRQTADDYIIEYVTSHASSSLILVSTDRKLTHYASQHGVTTLEALLFYKLLQESVEEQKIPKHKDQHVHKLSQEENPELDLLMEEAAGKVPRKKEDYDTVPKQQVSERLSKKERVLLNKLKKL